MNILFIKMFKKVALFFTNNTIEMKIVIIGGVAGGAATAARLRRLDEQAEIIMLDKGAYISYSNCGLPYYIGDVVENREQLFVETPQSFRRRLNIDVRVNQEVVHIDIDKKEILIRNHATQEEYKESFDKLVLSPGAKAFIPDVEGISNKRVFTLRNVPNTDAIKEFIDNNDIKNAVVAGGGFIGLEMVENLREIGIDISLVEAGNQVMPTLDKTMATFIHQELEKHNVQLFLENHITKIQENTNGLTLFLQDGKTIDTNMLILSIGVRPDVEMAKNSGIVLGDLGGIKVNEYLQTSHSDIYAVGDAIEVCNLITNMPMILPLAGPASKQGRIAANNIILGNHQKFSGVIGSSIAKIFNLTAASAGVNEKTLQKLNIPHISSYTQSLSHAGIYPGARFLYIKVLFAPDTGQLYGAQVTGYDGADKRIEMMAQVIQRKGSVVELAELEQAYAPPYSSAKDPVNTAGFVAENILLGKMEIVHVQDIQKHDYLLDVRTEKEYQSGHIENAVNIPLDDLRSRVEDLDKNRRIIIYCAGGMRAYFAYRILAQLGFEQIYNLSGGFKIYQLEVV